MMSTEKPANAVLVEYILSIWWASNPHTSGHESSFSPTDATDRRPWARSGTSLRRLLFVITMLNAYRRCAENIQKFKNSRSGDDLNACSPIQINNMDLWNHRSFADFDVLDCTLSKDWSDFFIFTDTGRSFASGRTNLRDYVGGKKTENIKSTSDLVNFINTQNAKQIKISTHPERWDNVPLEWAIQFGKTAINFLRYCSVSQGKSLTRIR